MISFENLHNSYDFSEKKQLEVIKMFAESDGFGSITITNIFGKWKVECSSRTEKRFENLQEAIINFIYRYWHVLTADERQRLIEILHS